ncbi:hypothetical protein M434DRAFT_379635 [Hypoxylon sp. CO27-5]|nr:hypothetical protein M434DRAFT_379635 [Hypoxylon sp. CO27-5]
MDRHEIAELVIGRINELVDQSVQAGREIVDAEALEDIKSEAVEIITNALQTLQANIRQDLQPMTEAAIAAQPNLAPWRANEARFHLELLAFETEAQAIGQLLNHYSGLFSRLILAETWGSEEDTESDDGDHDLLLSPTNDGIDENEETSADPNAAEEEQEEQEEQEQQEQQEAQNDSSSDNVEEED